VQFFAAFIDIKKVKFSPIVHTLQMIDKFYKEIEENFNFIEVACNYEDIVRIANLGKCAGMLCIEGGELIEGDLAVLRMLYKLGARYMTLTWNYNNQMGCGINCDRDMGLSEFGIEVVKEMNRIGMIIDLSHASEITFWDALRHSVMPVICSHSNAKGVCNHKRNLSDEQIKEVAKKEGVIGINFNPDFLNDSGYASIDDIIKLIEYISSLVGTEHIGIGSDFDGIDKAPQGCSSLECLSEVLNRLARMNYTEKQIKDISGENFLRLIKKVIA
jgi:membrane dipeptidase